MKNCDFNKILKESRRLLLETELTEKEIAGKIYTSEVYFRNMYKKVFGLPPRRYIRKVKLKKGRTLLRITDKTISEIAHDIGYINISKFSHRFRIEFGISPSEYRKSIRREN